MKVCWSLLAALTLAPSVVHATPSTDVWTPATTYMQPFAVPHITYDSYFNAARDYPTDLGLTVGVLPFAKLQSEIGVDYFAPAGPKQAYFNGKIGTPENAISKGMPGITAGVFGVGTQSEDKKKGTLGSMYNVVHGEVGRTFKYVGSLTAGGYVGNSKLLVDEEGRKDNTGFMVAWSRPLNEVSDKLAVGVDFMSGRNLYGALGAGLTILPTPAAGLILGWVHFNSPAGALSQASRTMWTAQLDLDMDVRKWFGEKKASQGAPVPVTQGTP